AGEEPAVLLAPVGLIGDHALLQGAREGLVHFHQPQVAHGLGEETGVQQMQDRMLDPTDVLVYWHPPVSLLGIYRPRRVVRRAVAEEVPRRIHEGVHRVGLAPGWAFALWALSLH